MLEINVDFDAVRDIFLTFVSDATDFGLDVLNYAEDRLTDFNNIVEEKLG